MLEERVLRVLGRSELNMDSTEIQSYKGDDRETDNASGLDEELSNCDQQKREHTRVGTDNPRKTLILAHF